MYPETMDEAIFALRSAVRGTRVSLAGVCAASGYRQPGLDKALKALDALVEGDPATVSEQVMCDAAEKAEKVFVGVMDRTAAHRERDRGIYERARRGYDDVCEITDAAKSIDVLRHTVHSAR